MLVLGGLAAGLCFVLPALVRVRRDPVLRERKRRDLLNRIGRLVEGTVLDLDDNAVYYTYAVNGVPYNTSQDVSALQPQLPVNRNAMIGEVQVKFAVNNPANSMIVSEEWSGFRPAIWKQGETK